jgi:hypothetical protein
MEVNGKAINMRAIRRQLEQHFQCRGLVFELEQQPDELEQQCGLSLRLQILKSGKSEKWNNRDCPFRHYAKSTETAFLVGHNVSKTRRFHL